MMNLSDIRAQYPQYHDLSDDQLLIGLHQKFYADIPIGKFTQMVNYDTNKPDPTDGMSGLDKFSAGAGKALVDLGRGASQFGAGVMDAIDPRGLTLSSLVTGQKPISRVDQGRADVAESRKLDGPLMNTAQASAAISPATSPRSCLRR
jgi:hypothetical protein